MDDGDGNVVDREIAVHRLITPLGDLPLSGGGAYAQEHHENRLYVAYGAGGLEVFDVTDPANAQFLGSIDTPGTAVSVAVAEYPAQTVAFVGDASGGISVFDVTDPANIILLQLLAVDVNDEASIDAAVWDVEIDDNKIIYVAETTGGFTTFDAADPESNMLLDSLDIALSGSAGEIKASVTNVELDGNRAYLALQNYGLVTINIADPANLLLINTSGIALSQPFGMARDDDTLRRRDRRGKQWRLGVRCQQPGQSSAWPEVLARQPAVARRRRSRHRHCRSPKRRFHIHRRCQSTVTGYRLYAVHSNTGQRSDDSR
jgi:hypothetical protein